MEQSNNTTMINEPRVIYLNCYDHKEKDPSCLPVDNDFQTLDTEFVCWSADTPCLDVAIKYVHGSVVEKLDADNKFLKEELERFRTLLYTRTGTK